MMLGGRKYMNEMKQVLYGRAYVEQQLRSREDNNAAIYSGVYCCKT